MCLFTSALRALVNKSHIPSLPQNNLYLAIPIAHGCLLYKNNNKLNHRDRAQININSDKNI